MPANAELSDNHRKLVENGVIREDAQLSSAENKVIEGLTPEEVDCLIKIRGKLSDAMAEDAGATRGEFTGEANSNFVV